MPNIITLPPEDYEPEEQSKNKKIPTFQEFLITDGSDLTPEEYNSYRNKYKSDYLGKFAEARYGQKPKKNVTEWQTAISDEESRLDAEFDKRFPARKPDSFLDKAANQARAFAGGVWGFGRSVANAAAGGDGPAGQYIQGIQESLREGMTTTEKIQAQRSQANKKYADEVGGWAGIKGNVSEIRGY